MCDTCCETAWDMTCGPVGGTDPDADRLIGVVGRILSDALSISG